MSPDVQAEVELARLLGLAWTPWRRWASQLERMGALQCGCVGCRRPTAFVSYCAHMPGRVARCEVHHAEREAAP